MKILLKPKSYWPWILMLAFLWPTVGLAEDPKIIKIIGKAEILKVARAQKRPAVTGQQLQPGDKLRVIGKGLVIVRQNDVVNNAWVTHDSELEYMGTDRGDQTEKFAVPQGVIYFEIKKGSKLDVQTTHLVASVRGTEFITHAKSKASRVRVISGKVKVCDASGRSELLHGGMRISATKKGLGLKAKKDTLQPPTQKSFFSRIKGFISQPPKESKGINRNYRSTDSQESRGGKFGGFRGSRSSVRDSRSNSVGGSQGGGKDSKGGSSSGNNASSFDSGSNNTASSSGSNSGGSSGASGSDDSSGDSSRSGGTGSSGGSSAGGSGSSGSGGGGGDDDDDNDDDDDDDDDD